MSPALATWNAAAFVTAVPASTRTVAATPPARAVAPGRTPSRSVAPRCVRSAPRKRRKNMKRQAQQEIARQDAPALVDEIGSDLRHLVRLGRGARKEEGDGSE